MKRIKTLCAVACAATALLFAQSSGAQSPVPVVHEDDFQSYGTQANPPGWVDTPVGSSKASANGLYKTWPDPEDAAKKNVVYGTKQSSGKPEGKNPKIGTFSTLATKSFGGKGRFEFRGRMMRTDEDGRIGLTFFSSYPEKDAYYLVGLWSQSGGTKLTMQLFSLGGSPVGVVDSGFTPVPKRWYAFLIRVDDIGGATEIRARFWAVDTQEPESFSIDARDITPSRSSTGRLGVWAAVKGDAYFDDFAAKSPIDHTPPAITVKGPVDGAVVTVPSINVTGAADDAVTVTVNGRAAAIDATKRTFELKGLELAEGSNHVTVVAKDEVGNAATVKVVVTLDTRAPEIAVLAPVMKACVDVGAIQLSGRVHDRAVVSVIASLNGGPPVEAVLAPDRQSWTATFEGIAESQHVASVEALDDLRHRALASVSFLVDRTAPTIDIAESGRPLNAGVMNRRAVPLIRVRDADPLVTFTATLDGRPYMSGTEVGEGRHHLHVLATDCAGHKSEKTIDFEVDTDAPSILTINPADGSTHGTKPTISGTTSPDATTITVEPTGATHSVTNGAFSLAALPLVDGVNDLVFVVADAAGNSSRKPYRITLKLSIPAVEITLDGVPIVAGALFNRAITPTIRATEADATIAATLDGAAYTVGTPIAAEGAHTLKAAASDAHGHTSESATATFTIDTTKPQVAITAPSTGATIAEAHVDVRGTVTGGDVESVRINGIATTLSSGAFTATVPLEAGPNTITATAVDRAGNAATVQIEVTRGGSAPGIVLTAPADGTFTNRTTTIVAGNVLTPSAVSRVTINGEEVPVDPTGAFRKSVHALVEGENTITAAARNNGGAVNESTVRVTADLTAPRLRILESGQPLADGSRFPERAILSVEATDGGVAVVPEIFIDNVVQTSSHTVAVAGGHTITAIARDRAGNESRVQRTFFIGGATAGGCLLERFDPPHGSVVTSNTVMLAGRSGGAAGVKVNGTPALVSSGSFCATVELPAEGDNVLTITCTDAAGAATGTPVLITLRRATGEPSITLTLPEEGKTTGVETITVSGTAAGAATVEVNGVAAALNGEAFSVSNVRLVAGLNVVSVLARSAAGRTSSASRRVMCLKDAPSLTITSPATSVTTGASTMDVSGIWWNLDPSTIAIAGATVSTTSFSDTSGSFIAASVALAPGQQTITATGRDALGRTASATASVTLTAGHPSIAITEPADNHVFASTAGDTVVVRGSFNAKPGSSVEVGGVTATLDTPSTFSASVPLASGRLTPIVAHVTNVDGASTADTVRVSKAAAKPKVSESFPAANAVQVDAAAMPMVLFSAPMDRGTTAAAVRLENAAGTAVSGTARLDRDVLIFAPAALLTSGERYTVRVGTAARAVSGDALEAEFTSAFIVAATAPRTPPVLSAVPGNICGSMMPISGTAPAGARLRIDLGTLSFATTASAAGAWSYQLPIGGSSGHQVVRVRIVGTDGSLSAAAESCFVVDCDGPQVTGATIDRAANKVTVVFTKELKASTVTSSAFQLTLSDGRVVASTIALQTPAKSVVLTPAEDLGAKSFALTVTTTIEDTSGKKLASPFTQQFATGGDVDPQPGDGSGYITGEVFDAETGRPLAGATIVVVNSALQSSSDSRGRYSFRVPEGAHTLRLTATGYTATWRQLLVPAGVGVNPIDVRLTPVGAKASIGSSELSLTHRDASLRIPAAALTPGTEVALTRLGAQSLPGLLPLGWSPLRAAVVASVAPALSGAELTFVVPTQTITAASQTLTAVRYDETRDDWIVLAAAVSATNDKVTVAIPAPGAYALVYPDAASGLARPPAALAGAPLQAAANPCAVTPCPDLKSKSFTLEPRVVLPSEKALVTLNVEGLAPAVYPSGTAVQAYVAEELQLADGSRVSDPPFTTDLLLYRSLTGDVGVAEFQLAPSAMAAQVVLDVGFDHINVLAYPGRLDRGTLVGVEGGKVPGDGRVTVEIPAGATTEAIHASTASISDLAQFGTIAGFEIVAGFTLTMQRAAQPQLPEGMTASSVELLQPAKATFAAAQTSATQFVLAEVLDATPYGRLFRLSSRIAALDASRVTTRPIDRATLPLDGIVREGRYLLLKATAPIAFATGTVKTTGGSAIAEARVTAPPLGVADVTRTSGLFNVTVPAGTTPFTLVPRSVASGDGTTYTHASGAPADSIVVVDLPLVGQPPQLTATEPAANATEVVLAPIVKATFAPGIDPTSVAATSIVVTDTSTGSVVSGRVSAQGTLAVIWTLPPGEHLMPNRRYAVTIAPTIRGTNGAPFGISHVFSFSTITQLATSEVHPEKIRITIPDANGQSRVTGDAGALPAGWNAVAVRRGVDFVTRFQATAAADGKFSFTITERVALSDMIDLQVVNAAGSVAAIIPLTPFVTEGGLGFVAPTDRAVTFHAANGVSVTTAAGTFDEPTVVTIVDAPKALFESVPNFATEINFVAGLAITFDGTAKKPLEVSIPIPAGTVTDGRTFLLGRLGDSARGPRIEIGDTLRVANGKFTTTEAAAGGSMRVQTLETTTGQKVKDYLLRIVHGAGKWAVIDLNTSGNSLGFAYTDGLSNTLDLFFSSFQSLYCSNYYLTASRGRAVFPFLANTPFVVEGVDSGSGLDVFRKSYEGVPLPPAGGVSPIGTPMPNESGPYPVFGNPFFVHVVDVDATGVKFVPAPDMLVELPDTSPPSTQVTIARSGASPAQFGAINITQSKLLPLASDASRTLDASLGNRLVVYGSAADVAPTGRLEIVFNEAIDFGGNLANLAKLVRLDKREGSVWVAVPVDYEADSGDRRITVILRGELQRGGQYRLTLDASISDTARPPKTLGFDVFLPFNVREPHGKLAELTIPDGSVRDMALDGNLLFVAATDGDLLAYDVSNPASLNTAMPIARASATAGTPTDIQGDTWSVTVDHHGRIWTTALTSTFGVIRSFRVEDFVPAIPNQVRAATQVAAGIVSWRPGINAGLPLGTTWTTASDRAEGIPRKMQIAVQDQSFRATGGSDFLTAFTADNVGADASQTGTAGVANEFRVYTITVPRTPLTPANPEQFRQQRVTVRNKTLGLRWSGEILGTASGVSIPDVLVREGDEIEVLRNYGTYAVVTLFGYGVGFYDLGAMEHNQRLPRPEKQYAMQLALTEGRVMHPIVPTIEAPACDPSVQSVGYPCPPRALTFATDAAVLPNGAGFALYPLETRSGIVTVTVDPIAGSQESSGSFAQNGAQVKRSVSDHLIFTGGTGASANDHPRLKPVRDAFAANGRVPATRFTNIERFDVGPKSYGLVAANQFGLLVVDLAAPIGANALADVIWAPAGIYGVRHIRGTHFATAVDGQGRTLLIDLSRVDERNEAASIASCGGSDCLFPTLKKALAAGPDSSDTTGWRFGAWDPRIIWRADDSDLVNGTLAPVADPDTGFIFNGEVTQKTIDVLHGLEPRISVKANLGHGSMQEVGAVVPLGIAQPPAVNTADPNGSLGAFRVEVALPGSMSESTGGAFTMSIESERVPGAKTEASPSIPGWPASHLDDVVMRHVVPAAYGAALRYQKGWNLFVSEPIVAIADPRAAKAYSWSTASPADQEKAGCFACEPPKWAETGSREIYSMGRFFRLRPSSGVAASPYGYLANQNRLETTIGTVMADTVRPPDVLVAAQNPPVAHGMIQETIYLHSGELETSAVDFDAGGRAGWNVTLDRTYRSRTVGMTPLGFGWEASYLKRLRAMPSGDVEYRDGAGEIWTFRYSGGGYEAPEGIFLKLVRTERSWLLRDQKSRISYFDDFGRITAEGDEFHVPGDFSKGNVIRYVYGADGRLARIVDPVNRATEFTYGTDGLIAQISDWRSVKRNVNYLYTAGKLQRAELPSVANTSNARPRVDYTYVAGASGFNEQLELATNLESITDPKEALGGGSFRVKHAYGTSPLERDRVTLQQWGSSPSDKATFAYPSLTNATTTDVLGQQRSYTLTAAPATFSADRVHVAEMRELAVKVAPTPFGQLPTTMPVGAVTSVEKDRVRTFTHDKGMMKTAALAEVRQTTNEPAPAAGGIGYILKSVSTNPFGTTGAMSTNAASLLPPTSPIVRKFHYQPGSNFLAAVEEDGKKVNSVEPHRGKKEPSETNDSVETKRVLNDAGQLSKVQSAGGTDSTATGGAEETIEYWGLTDPAHKRGLPKKITRGTLITTIDYPTEDSQVEIDESRHVVTRTEFDAWLRPVKVATSSANDPLVITQTFAYDATGRIKKQTEAKGSTEYDYDVLGRRTLMRRDGVAVAGGTLETSVTYDLANRKISTKRPGGAVETTTLDKLGRSEKIHIETGPTAGASDIETFFAYDLDGNRVYESDGFVSSATAYDAHGRVIGTKASDGTVRTTEYDTWSQPKAVKEYSAAATPAVIGSTTFDRSDTGRLESIATAVDAATTRTTQMAWDGAGRTTSVATDGRASKSTFDTAGRLLHSSAGAGNLAALTQIFDKQQIVSHDGDLPAAIKTEEKSGAPHTTELAHDTAGATVETKTGSLEWKQRFDAQGDIVSASAPGRPAATYETDSRGAVKKETLPDGVAENKYDYDLTGAQSVYTDPANEPTATINDLLGRPLRRDYKDGTSELVEWEGSRIKAVTDRQGRKLVYGYNVKGQLATIKNGAGAALDEITYDDAGRMTVWRTPDAEVSWGPEFDNEGRPKKTAQKRFRDGTGLTTRQVLDEWVQEHRWNEHGERTAWSMPAYAGLTFGSGWTKWVREAYDAMGNLVAIGKVDGPAATTAIGLMSADHRNAGRPDVRTVFTGATTSSAGTPIVRQYGYHDEKSLLNRMTVTVGGVVVAGSAIEHDGVQIGSIRMLGISGGNRHSTFSYDTRSRVSASLFGRLGEAAAPVAPMPGRAAEAMSVADFRAGQARQSRLDPSVASSLGAVDTAKVDPPSMTASEKAGGGHKIAEVQRGAKVYPFGWNGAEAVDDGRFLYAFDAKGRLVSATEKVSVAPVRRMVYYYSGLSRLVGRRAEYSTVFPAAAGDWKLEDRPQVLAADGLPADTTLVWDAITDRLVTVARAAATTADPHGGLLKQVIHGGAGYDDPIETATIDPFATASVNYLYPIYDEAGAGALEAVLNRTGDVVARSVANDPYGADPLDLVGAAVDRVKIWAKKTNGAIAEVELSIGLTEQVSAASVAAGVRLAALDAAGTLLRTATTAPSLVTDDATTVRWTLTQSEWSALTAGAAKVSIAVTNGLRAEAWGADVPVMPAPEWAVAALPVRTSAELPVELRESISTLTTWIDGLSENGEDTRKLYEVEALALLASSRSGTQDEDILASRMHAHPFTEPMTGLDYVRARWYQPLSGTWLTPDPVGYRDSSNLYAFCGGDPVNCRDPQGLESLTPDERRTIQAKRAAEQDAISRACTADPTLDWCRGFIETWLANRWGDKNPNPLHGGNAFAVRENLLIINGVWNSMQGAHGHIDLIATSTKQRVSGVFNPTQGKIADLKQTAINKLNVRDETTKMVIREMKRQIAALPAGQTLRLVAHSQAAAIVSSATGYLTPAERARIDLLTFGGAAWHYPSDFHSRKNVVNLLDFIVADWAGNGATAFAGVPGMIIAALDPHLEFTMFTSEYGHGFDAYWNDYMDRHDPVRVNQRVHEQEIRRHEMALRNWNKR